MKLCEKCGYNYGEYCRACWIIKKNNLEAIVTKVEGQKYLERQCNGCRTKLFLSPLHHWKTHCPTCHEYNTRREKKCLL